MPSAPLASASSLPVDLGRLQAFEDRLDTTRPPDGTYQLLGVGRYAPVLAAPGFEGLALKRLPPFASPTLRMHYERAVNAYHQILRDPIGLQLPAQVSLPLTNAHGHHLLYVVQERLDPSSTADRLLRQAPPAVGEAIFLAVLRNVLRVWHRNEIEKELEVRESLTGLDARLSNWAVTLHGTEVADVVYLDTATPFLRRMGQDRLAPDLFLQGLPGWYAGLQRERFRADVLDRCYDFRLTLLDLLAELHRSDAAERLPFFLDLTNAFLEDYADDLFIDALHADEVVRYARQEARFWKRMLRHSRRKRFISGRLLRQPYPILLAD